MHITNEQIKDFLVDTGLMTKVDLKHYTDSDDLSNVLVSDGRLSDCDVARMTSYILGIPFVDLSKDKISYDDLSNIPESISRKHNAVSFGREGDKLKVAFTDPVKIEEVLNHLDSDNIIPYITHQGSIKRSLVEYQKGLQYDYGDSIKKHAVILNERDDNRSAIKILDTILRHAIAQGASIIHIESDGNNVLIRYRSKGKLYDAMTLPNNVYSSIERRVRDLSGTEKGGFKFTTEDKSIFVSSSVSENDQKIVMKLYSDSEDVLLENMYFSQDNIDKLHTAIHSKNGMVLVSGPIKSGKTTTMYSLLDIINSPNLNIVTIEENIKRNIPRVNQVKVDGEDREMYLRSIPGQDADVVMVDNMDSSDEVSILTNLSLTNHLILASLQSDSAAECLYKICNIGIDPFIIKNSVRVIINQKTLKKLGDNKEKYTLSKAGISSLSKIIDMDNMLQVLKDNNIVDKKASWKSVDFYRPKKGDGYEGRLGIQEVLVISETIKDLMMSGSDVDVIEKQAQKEGMITTLEDGIMKAAMGLTTLEEVLRVASK